jgi:hypothetical protein
MNTKGDYIMNMKKFCKLIILIILGMLFYTSAKNINVPYAIKCYKCWESKVPYTNMGLKRIAHRSFKDEYSGRKMEGYCVYRCEHGHILYVNYDTGDKQ